MTTSVAFSPAPILQFFDNAGRPNAGGSILTQVGGVNYPTYSDSAGTTPLPNPIPLNSRGEVSTAAGASSQLFLDTSATYTFTLYDKNGNVLNQATRVGNTGFASLANLASTSEGKGADLVGNAVKRVLDIPSLAALTSLTTDLVVIAEFFNVNVLGNPVAGGGGAFFYDTGDTTTGAVFTASFSGYTMTVTAVTNGTINVGDRIITNDGGFNNFVAAFGTGSGGVGTYTMSSNPTILVSQQAVTCDVGTCVIDTAGKRWKRIYNGPLSSSWFGTVGDGSTDNTANMNAAGRSAKAIGAKLIIPAGVYEHTDVITFDSIVVEGEGDGTELKATDTTGTAQAIYLTGSGVKLRDVKTSTTWAGARQSDTNSHAVSLVSASNFEVAGVHVTGSAAAGILGQLCSYGSAHDNIVASTLADGIQFTNASSYISMFGNKTESTGDDALSVVSYNDGTHAQSSTFVICGNEINGGSARGVSIVGSANVNVFGNVANATAGAGFNVSSESAFTTYAANDVYVHGNKANGCATSGVLNHPQFFMSSNSSTYSLSNVVFANNRAYGSPSKYAFRAEGYVTDCVVDGMKCDETGKLAVLNATATRFSMADVEANNVADGVYELTNSTGDISILRGTSKNVFTTPSLSRYVNVNTCSGITALDVSGHVLDGAGVAPAALIGGDGSVPPNAITSIGNKVAGILLGDIYATGLNVSTFSLTLPQVGGIYIENKLSEDSANPFEINWTTAKHQSMLVEFHVVLHSDPNQYQLLTQTWMYTNAAGVGTAGVDYVDVAGGFRYQRTDITNVNNGSFGTWAMTFSTPTVTATFTPAAQAHMSFDIRAVYKAG